MSGRERERESKKTKIGKAANALRSVEIEGLLTGARVAERRQRARSELSTSKEAERAKKDHDGASQDVHCSQKGAVWYDSGIDRPLPRGKEEKGWGR